MALVDSVALAAAEKLAHSAGAKAGLAAFKTLALSVASTEGRARAILGALRCATALRDGENVSVASGWWPSIKEGGYLREIVALCNDLVRAGMREEAVALAAAEVARYPSARASYLHGRCLELVGHDAARAYADAVARAEKEGAADVGALARLRRAESIAREPTRVDDAVAEAKALDPVSLPPVRRLAWARVALRSSSRFARAAALGVLEELGTTGAVRLAALHADAMGDALTPLEADRTRAVLRRWPVESEREAALARLGAVERIAAAASALEREAAVTEAAQMSPDAAAHLVRARAVLSGAGGGPRSGAARGVADLALDALVALRAARQGEAVEALAAAGRALREEDEAAPRATGAAAAPLPVAAWTALDAALASESSLVVGEAATFAETILARPRAPSPRGHVGLAGALRRAGREDLCVAALRLAAAQREAGAHDALVRATSSRAWEIATHGGPGARAEALRLLRQARGATGSGR